MASQDLIINASHTTGRETINDNVLPPSNQLEGQEDDQCSKEVEQLRLLTQCIAQPEQTDNNRPLTSWNWLRENEIERETSSFRDR